MPHKVEISDKTFERLKEYCELNGLKIGQCADKLIFDGLMIEMYGDVPFTNYRKVREMVEIPVKENVTIEPLPEKQETTAIMSETEEITDKTETPPEKSIRNTMKENGVPTKVVNKITKRRLK